LKIKWNERDFNRAVYALPVCLISIAFYCLLINLGAVSEWIGSIISPITPIFFGLILAYLLNPILKRFESVFGKIKAYSKLSLRRKRFISMIATYVFTTAMVGVFLWIVLPRVIASATQLAMQMGTYANAAERLVTIFLEEAPEGMITPELAEQLEDFAGNFVMKTISLLGGSLPAVFGSLVWVGNFLIDLFVAVVVSVYILAEKESFGARAKKIVYALLPRAGAENLLEVVRIADDITGGFIIGKIVDSTIIGILCYIGTTALQMPNALLVSFIVGVTNVIPYFGPFIGAIPSFFLIAIVSLEKGLIFAVFILILQQLDGNVIGPKILGDSIGLSSFWIVFSVLFFGGALGIKGMIIGVPLFALIYWWSKIMVADRLAAKGLPTETSAYKKEGSPSFDEE